MQENYISKRNGRKRDPATTVKDIERIPVGFRNNFKYTNNFRQNHLVTFVGLHNMGNQLIHRI